MSRFKLPMTASAIVFLLADIVVGYRIWEGGWPRHISFVSTKEGVGQMQVVPIAFTGTDWLILILAVAVQASLICMVWNAWRAGSSDSKSRQQ